MKARVLKGWAIWLMLSKVSSNKINAWQGMLMKKVKLL